MRWLRALAHRLDRPVPGEYHALTGEDRLLDRYFAGKPRGFFVEVGAYDGVAMSNSYYFERRGWRGILVEAHPELAEHCRRARPGALVLHCAVVPPGSPPEVIFEVYENAPAASTLSLSERERHNLELRVGPLQARQVTVPALTLDEILAEHCREPIDFLTIDVEGGEWGVLQGFTLDRWQPAVLLVERNAPLPDWHVLAHLHRHHYILRHRTGTNDWFFPAPLGAADQWSYRLWLCWFFYGRSLPRSLVKEALKYLLVRVGVYRQVLRRLGRL